MQRFVIVEIDVAAQPLQPFTRYIVNAVAHFDLRPAVRAVFGRGDVFRFIGREGRQLCERLRDRFHQRVDPGAGRRGNQEELAAVPLRTGRDFLTKRFVVTEIGLGRDENLRTLRQLRAVARELAVDRFDVFGRVRAFRGGKIEQMQNQAAAVDVAQKIVAEARAVRRALDQAGYIGHDEAAVVNPHDA